MKLFTCSVCQQVLFFENVKCERCGHALAYLPERQLLSALEPESDGIVLALAPEAGRARYKQCDNYSRNAVCNWAVPAESGETLCQACRLNRTIPDLSTPGARQAWLSIETAKRRVLYTLLELGLPVTPLRTGPPGQSQGLAFSFKADRDGEKVFTGHAGGLITINVAEADAVFRERARCELGERYRTLLGHVRHEIGHYYWDLLVRDASWLESFRAAFGDERADYDQARKRHYAQGAPADWQSNFVSAYASMHPWEDWAESFAHYLHMVDTLETARSYGLALRPASEGGARITAMSAHRLQFADFDDLIAAWFPLTMALNSLNRSMGLPDPYPFVLGTRAVDRLRFVHAVVEARATTALRDPRR